MKVKGKDVDKRLTEYRKDIGTSDTALEEIVKYAAIVISSSFQKFNLAIIVFNLAIILCL